MVKIQRNFKLSPARIFLSYAREDRNKILFVYKKLKIEKLDPWLDVKDLVPGQEWERVLLSAIREARLVLVFLSPNSVTKRGYVQKEISRALDIAEEVPEGESFIIPVRIENCVIPERLKKWQCVDLFESGGLSKLLYGIKTHIKSKSSEDTKKLKYNTGKKEKNLDKLLAKKFSATGKLYYGQEFNGKSAISNMHMLEFRKLDIPVFVFLSMIKDVRNIHILTKSMIERVVPTFEEYHSKRFLLKSIEKHPNKGNVRVLKSHGGIICGIDYDYLMYIQGRYLDAKIYICGVEKPIVVEKSKQVVCIIMPMLLEDKKKNKAKPNHK